MREEGLLMRIAVLGATGRTGVHVVRVALDRGHDVAVLVRDEDKARRLLGASLDAVTVVVGDARTPADVARVAAGADAVVSALGPVKGSPPDLMERSARAAVDAVRSLPRRRLVWLTGAGVRRPGDTPGLGDRAIVAVMRLVTPALLRDSVAGVDVVTGADGVAWTVVRGPRLTDGAARGTWRMAERVGGGHGTQLPRADLAAVLLDLAESDEQVGAAPVVSS
jgi:uncharacterized protein YbjT (DUF2867 family)